jgi:hypothetical protein
MHLHHLTYERRGKELPADVVYLCLPCHGKQHPHHTFRPVWEQARRARSKKAKAQRDKKKALRKARPPMAEREKDSAYDRVKGILASRKHAPQKGKRYRTPGLYY